MGLLHNLRLRLRPPHLRDPDFGDLVFMYIPAAPYKSYWEAEWRFPPTESPISIDLLGGESGPLPEAREFYLALPDRFAGVLDRARSGLDRVFREWYDRPLSADMWQDVRLTGIGLETPRASPPAWDISFEATGDTWLGITVPFLGDTPGTPVVDT